MRPHIVYILSDEHSGMAMSHAGDPNVSTPNMDRMANQGVSFTNAYANCPICTPSRGMIFSGRYAHSGPVQYFFDVYKATAPSTATILRDVGYHTAYFGKWHCGDQPDFLPTRHGFDGWFGLPYSNDMGRQASPEMVGPYRETMAALGTPVPKDAPMLAERPPLPLMRDEEVVAEQPAQAALTERYVADAVQFLRHNRDRPFFLYLAHLYVHLPI